MKRPTKITQLSMLPIVTNDPDAKTKIFKCEVCRRKAELPRDAIMCPHCGGQTVPMRRRL